MKYLQNIFSQASLRNIQSNIQQTIPSYIHNLNKLATQVLKKSKTM